MPLSFDPVRLRHRRADACDNGADRCTSIRLYVRAAAERLDRPACSMSRSPARSWPSGFGDAVTWPRARPADAVCDAVQVIKSGTSLDGVDSTIERRAKLPGQKHVRAGRLRSSVGCGYLDGLWCYLVAALPDRASVAAPSPTAAAAHSAHPHGHT